LHLTDSLPSDTLLWRTNAISFVMDCTFKAIITCCLILVFSHNNALVSFHNPSKTATCCLCHIPFLYERIFLVLALFYLCLNLYPSEDSILNSFPVLTIPFSLLKMCGLILLVVTPRLSRDLEISPKVRSDWKNPSLNNSSNNNVSPL